MEVDIMKTKTRQITSITLGTLVIATMFPVADAGILSEKETIAHVDYTPTSFYMVGFVLLDWEVIVHELFLYGFRVLMVICIEYQEINPIKTWLLGPRTYIDFDDYFVDGVVNTFTICALLTPR
jgi:hypothetical protein